MNLVTLTTGNAIKTSVVVDWVPSIILIGDAGAVPAIEGLIVTIGGRTVQQYQQTNANVLNTLAQLGHDVADGANNLNGSYFMISRGFIKKQTCQLDFINSGAFTPIVYGYSMSKGNVDDSIVSLFSDLVLVDQSQLFEGDTFDYLVFEDDNFNGADIEFADGHFEGQLTEAELMGLLATTTNVPAGVAASDVIAIDNTFGNIKSVTLYATTGNLSVARQDHL